MDGFKFFIISVTLIALVLVYLTLNAKDYDSENEFEDETKNNPDKQDKGVNL